MKKLIKTLFMCFFVCGNFFYGQNSYIPSCIINSETNVSSWSITPGSVPKSFFNGNCIAMYVNNLFQSVPAQITSPTFSLPDLINYEIEISYGLAYTQTPFSFELISIPSNSVVSATSQSTIAGTCPSWPNPKITKLNYSLLIAGNYQLRITIPNASQFFIQSLKSSHNYSLNIHDFENSDSQLHLSPNPTSNSFKIIDSKNTNLYFNYSIIDLSGKLINRGISKVNEMINIQNLNSGSYIIQILTENGDKQSKIVIKK